MATSTETTPLMASATGGGDDSSATAGHNISSSYYFLDRHNSDVRSVEGGGSTRGAGTVHSMIDTVPDGAASTDFESRPVMHRGGSTAGSKAKPGGLGFFDRLFGKKSTAFQATSVVSGLRPRTGPVKVEPKVFFSNERTFLAWLHVSVILAGASVAISAFADANPWSQLYGVLLLPVAIAFICYSMYQYARRANMIRRKDPGPYEDLFGPSFLGIMLMVSIIAQFSIKLYEIM